ncbi:hypothetical protein D3C76_205100 [compost metagenome]
MSTEGARQHPHVNQACPKHAKLANILQHLQQCVYYASQMTITAFYSPAWVNLFLIV